MSLSITDRCVNCYACMDVCPSDAIAIVEEALLDGLGEVIHPPGSLTGIPPTLRLVEVSAELQVSP